MQVSNANNVKIYSVTSAARSAIPDWLAKKNIKSLKKDQDWRRRIELIQDFDFPEASLRIKSTRDGNFILATGVYQPQLRVFELAQKSMKFDRHQDCENVNFEILSDDWTKTIMLQSDRTIELHTQFGLHYKTRVPKFGRDLKYHYPSCDLLVGGASNEVWRLNLEAGRFMTSMSTSMPAVNTLDINPAHQLFGFGGEDGRLEFFHPTQHRRIGALDVASAVTKAFGSQDAFPEVSSIKFCPDGLSLAVGTSTGQILIYDLRSATPLTQKDHQYGFPIKSLSLHNSGNIISADTKIIKIWEMQTGKPFTSIEPPADINDVLTYPDSGLIMAANEGVPIQTFYIPQLGPAPKWCAYLDNLTEEMEENPQTTVYDDYKFVTRKDLEQLSLDHLIGTNVLKAYMHGFFVDLRLYEKAKAIANPFQFDEHKRKMVEQKIAKQRESRIRAIKNLPKINRDMAAKLLKTQKSSDDEGDTSDLDSKKTKKRKQIPVEGADSKNPLGDGRFSALFEDEDFQIDRTSHEYMLHHPSERVGGTAHSNKKRRNDNSGSDDDRELAGDGDLSDPHTSDESSDFDSDDSGKRSRSFGTIHFLYMRSF
ncbi:WD40-repeat-containing domain protein [Gaertneriomyces semiglobifer]|nr:WD40-repeat-containing domain protein [Gaertneriomyces semiglobifer]